MIHSHCGEHLLQYRDNPVFRTWRCRVCLKSFKQRKRKKKPIDLKARFEQLKKGKHGSVHQPSERTE